MRSFILALCLSALAPLALSLQPHSSKEKSAVAVSARAVAHDGEHLGKTAAARSELKASLLQQAPGGRASTSTHKNWFQRLGDAFTGVIVGILLVFISVPILWVGERRTAQMESLIGFAETEYKTIDANSSSEDNNGDLVYLSNLDARGLDAVADARFKQVSSSSGVVKLVTTVEVYQWVETSHTKEEKDNVGGGSTEKTTYTYSKEWRTDKIDSDQFFDRNGHENVFPVKGLELGGTTVVNQKVEYGSGYYLTEELASQLDAYEDASKKGNPFNLGDTLSFGGCFGGTTFKQSADHFLYEMQLGQLSIGDTRVFMKYVPDGPATVMALQDEGKTKDRMSFLPYRTIQRGWCGDEEEVLKERLTLQGRKELQEVVQEEETHLGPLDCICCCCIGACNLITTCIMSLAYPQVYHAWSGHLSASVCVSKLNSENSMISLGLRIGGWLCMWIGSLLIMKPFLVILDIIPFLGPWLSNNLAFLLGILSLFMTIGICGFICGLAYLRYHPTKALTYLVMPVLVVAGAVYLYMESQKS
eukprot:TRINITY_DN17982_c0_g1_i1.p1 TRINITY_DN17982_c0_g1~~TRINITY_DN17982_c0_g1_i1.p1  ORF type:complete len:532 (-),score=113.14 TRINITY_DN17982_c0_g1_i1:148-1743(-)